MKDIKLEIIKQKIISDIEYQKWMKEIANMEKEFASSSDFNNKIALDHGIEHMNRVAINVYKLMNEYGCDKNICNLGYIAGLIHDIGIIHGKKNYAENGSNMVEVFLKKFDLLNDIEIEEIKNAVATHSDGENAKNYIGLFLAIADKIDMCKERFLGKTSPIQDICSYSSNININTLEIHYEMSSPKGIEALYMIPKSIDVPTKIANSLGIKIKFYINGKSENFVNRKEFKGKIYKS